MTTPNLHQEQAIARAGQRLDQAQAALILLHGRGASAADILLLAEELYQPAYAYLAPQAANNTWYPYTFLAPMQQNEPWLSSALARVGEVVALVEAAGIPAERIVLGGFSQGACLASEFMARHARRYGGLLAFSGGLIGPPGTPRAYTGSLDGTGGGDGRCAGAPGRAGDHALLPRHGPHHQRGRNQPRAQTAAERAYCSRMTRIARIRGAEDQRFRGSEVQKVLTPISIRVIRVIRLIRDRRGVGGQAEPRVRGGGRRGRARGPRGRRRPPGRGRRGWR